MIAWQHYWEDVWQVKKHEQSVSPSTSAQFRRTQMEEKNGPLQPSITVYKTKSWFNLELPYSLLLWAHGFITLHFRWFYLQIKIM